MGSYTRNSLEDLVYNSETGTYEYAYDESGYYPDESGDEESGTPTPVPEEYSYVRDTSEDLVYNPETGHYEYAHSEESGDESGSEESGESGHPIPPQPEYQNSTTLGNNPIINFTVGKLQVKQVIIGNILVWEYEEPVPPVPPVPVYTLTITPDPISANVELLCGEQTISGTGIQEISVKSGSIVNISVSATGYETRNVPIEVNDNIATTISLNKNNYTLTVITDPVDATITFDTGTVSDHSVTVPYNTTITYIVSKSGYISSQPQTYTVIQTETITGPTLTPAVVLTVNPTTPGATVRFNTAGTVSGNSITVARGATVSYTLTSSGHDTRTVSETVNTTESVSPQMHISVQSPVVDTAGGTVWNVTNWISRGQGIAAGTYYLTRAGGNQNTIVVGTNARGEITSYSTSGNITSRSGNTGVTMTPTNGWNDANIWE